jgi:hypothetical protein
MSAFGRRSPLYSDDVPLSPVLVYKPDFFLFSDVEVSSVQKRRPCNATNEHLSALLQRIDARVPVSNVLKGLLEAIKRLMVSIMVNQLRRTFKTISARMQAQKRRQCSKDVNPVTNSP